VTKIIDYICKYYEIIIRYWGCGLCPSSSIPNSTQFPKRVLFRIPDDKEVSGTQ
jgi:hypothetical protein